MKTSRIILIAGIAILMVLFGINLAGNSSTYSSFEEAKRSGKTVHIAGEWVKRELAQESPNEFVFYVQDSTHQQVERVLFYDPKPSNFEQAEKIVLIGKYRDEGFVADKIITKCPSKYEETEIKIQ